MAVYGTSYGKFKSGITVVDMNHCNIIPEWQLPQVIKHVSIINGKPNFIKITSDKSRFSFIINLWKYAVPATSLTDFLTYNHTSVKLMPHQDFGTYLLEIDGVTEADFYITKMRPFYLKNRPPLLQDKLLIIFESINPTLMPGITPGFLWDESEDFLVDEEGDKLIKES